MANPMERKANRRPPIVDWRIGACFLLLLIAHPSRALANAGPPSSGGQYAGEPAGIEDIFITREQLTIDMRPLAAGGLVRVEAIYQLKNQGERKQQDLLFAIGSSGVSEFQVEFDSDAISSQPVDAELPESWQPPSQTPKLDAGRPPTYSFFTRSQTVPMAFTISIPPGDHTLRVSYVADATKHFSGHPTVYRQFAYVLAPARSWAGFGGLDVTVHVPPNWRAATTPALTRERDTLSGSFDSLPADAIAMTVQSPSGWAYEALVYGGLALLGLVGVGGVAFCWQGGRSLSRGTGRHLPGDAEPKAAPIWPRALGLGAVWAVAIWGAGAIIFFGPDWVLPAHQATRWNYGHFFGLIGISLLGILAAPLGFGVTLLAASLNQQRES